MNGWMKATISRPYIRRLFSSLTVDDDVETLEFELSNSIDEDSDKDFADEVIAQGMVI